MKKLEDLLKKIEEKKKKLDKLKPLSQELKKSLEDWYRVELTYSSNAIEGNSLTKRETAQVVEKGLGVAGKEISEQLEAINHGQAFDYVKKLSQGDLNDFGQKDILKIHKIILTKIDDRNAGRYRQETVRVAGSETIFPNPAKVPQLMDDYSKWLNSKLKDENKNKVELAAEAHYRLVKIHPFVDGNGRVARLIMNLILLHFNYPPAEIKKEERQKYLKAIEKADQDDLADFKSLIYQSELRSLNYYLKSVEGFDQEDKERKDEDKDGLLKIGELADKAGEKVSTVRYWVSQGLIKISKHTTGGYMLFDKKMLEKAKEIRQLQKEKRLTIEEIEEEL